MSHHCLEEDMSARRGFLEGREFLVVERDTVPTRNEDHACGTDPGHEIGIVAGDAEHVETAIAEFVGLLPAPFIEAFVENGAAPSPGIENGE